MKKLLILTLLFTISISLSAQSKKNPIYRQWMLTKIGKMTKQYLIEKKGSITIGAEMSSAITGCNNISFGCEILKGNKLKFKNGIMPEMACEMDLETEILKLLDKSYQYKIKGHRLTLTSDKGEKIEFVAADFD